MSSGEESDEGSYEEGGVLSGLELSNADKRIRTSSKETVPDEIGEANCRTAAMRVERFFCRKVQL